MWVNGFKTLDQNVAKMEVPNVWFVVFLTITINFNDAQRIIPNQDSFMVSEATVYGIVQNVFMTKFASIDEKISRILSLQNRQIFSGSDASMLLDLNERVSKLENELQRLKENQSSKELSEMDLLKKK